MARLRLLVVLAAIIAAVGVAPVAEAAPTPWYCRWFHVSGCPTTPPTTTTTTPPPPTTTTTQPPTTTTTTTTTTTSSPPAPQYFATAPSGQCPKSGACAVATQLPRADSFCAANVTPTTQEQRPANATANNTRGPATTWGPWAISSYWANATANFQKVTGNYTGTTTQIIQWAACKWGIDEDVIRAVAVQESNWNQANSGDNANGCDHSFGLTSVKDSPNDVCPINHSGYGGMPGTRDSTALNVDFYGAYIRSCFDGDYYDGSSYLYGGQTVAQRAAASGWDYVLWGCVGTWFSGSGWYDAQAQSYINSVKGRLADRAWTKPGF